MKRLTLNLAVNICLAVLCSWPGFGQEKSLQNREPLSEPLELKIVAISGQNAEHDATLRRGVQTVVEVRDQNDQTVPNVSVVFELPASGPGGSFPNSSLRQQTLTSFNGQASTSGFVPNTQDGPFELRVRASIGERRGTAVIPQANVTQATRAAAKSKSKLWIIIGAAAAGGTVAALVAGSGSSNGGSSSPGRSISLTPGAVTVNAPR